MTQFSPQPIERPILEIKDLKTYFYLERSTVRALDGVNLSLMAGRTLGLVGESGCGKSIMAMSVMRLIPSPPGKIVAGQINLYHNDKNEVVNIAALESNSQEMRSIRGGQIAIIFQEPMTSLNPLQTVGAQIAEMVTTHHHISQKEAMDHALEMLTRVQIACMNILTR